MLLFLNPTIKTQWKVWLFIQTFHCVFQHIHRRSSSFTTLWIYTILKPHVDVGIQAPGFTTLWIYTILKQMAKGLDTDGVSLPYEFTLFSNMLYMYADKLTVLLPYEFTLFSNVSCTSHFACQFHYLMNLHYSQTINSGYTLTTLVSLPYGFTLFSNQQGP